jgi:guanine deaminase
MHFEEIMKKAIEEAKKTMNEDIGGPFGAAIVDQSGKLIAVSSNSVLRDKDPTAHAEINVIRKVGQILGTHDLSGCTIITTAFPCPMCLGAIMWANMRHVVYGCRPEDAEKIGFRDDHIYRFIQDDMQDIAILDFVEEHRDICLKLFEEYALKEKIIY